MMRSAQSGSAQGTGGILTAGGVILTTAMCVVIFSDRFNALAGTGPACQPRCGPAVRRGDGQLVERMLNSGGRRVDLSRARSSLPCWPTYTGCTPVSAGSAEGFGGQRARASPSPESARSVSDNPWPRVPLRASEAMPHDCTWRPSAARP